MLLSLRKNCLASLFKEVRVFKVTSTHGPWPCLLPRRSCEDLSKCAEIQIVLDFCLDHRVLQGAPPRGRQLCFTFQVLPTLYSKRQKHPFSPEELQPRRGHPVKHHLIFVWSAANLSTFCASFFPSFFPLPTVPFLPESPPLLGPQNSSFS